MNECHLQLCAGEIVEHEILPWALAGRSVGDLEVQRAIPELARRFRFSARDPVR